MARLLRWFRKAMEQPGASAQNPEEIGEQCHLLQLPGEIRNQIYDLIIYPGLDKVLFANIQKPEHLSGSVLQLSLFRVSHQIRSEALSYLCATKVFKILGFDTANAVFDCLGPAIGDLKRLSMHQPLWEVTPESKDRVDCFFDSVKKAKTLKGFSLDGYGKSSSMEEGGAQWAYKKLAQEVGQGKDVELHIQFG